MRSHLPTRLTLGAASLVLFAVAPVFARVRQPKAPPAAVQKQSRPEQARPEQGRPEPPRAAVTAQNQANQQHLQEWMDNHKNLSLTDQQRALESEPGFHELPPQVQQRY